MFSSSEKNAGAILIWIALDVYIDLCSIDILTIFDLPVYEHGIFFHLCVCVCLQFFS